MGGGRIHKGAASRVSASHPSAAFTDAWRFLCRIYNFVPALAATPWHTPGFDPRAAPAKPPRYSPHRTAAAAGDADGTTRPAGGSPPAALRAGGVGGNRMRSGRSEELLEALLQSEAGQRASTDLERGPDSEV